MNPIFKKILVLGVTTLVLTGCSYPSIPSTPPADTNAAASPATAVSGSTIIINNFKFSPTTLTVKSGATIIVTNSDSVGHTATSDDGTSFDTGMLAPGESKTITVPSQPGTYAYHCTPHPYMKGTLVVE